MHRDSTHAAWKIQVRGGALRRPEAPFRAHLDTTTNGLRVPLPMNLLDSSSPRLPPPSAFAGPSAFGKTPAFAKATVDTTADKTADRGEGESFQRVGGPGSMLLQIQG